MQSNGLGYSDKWSNYFKLTFYTQLQPNYIFKSLTFIISDKVYNRKAIKKRCARYAIFQMHNQ